MMEEERYVRVHRGATVASDGSTGVSWPLDNTKRNTPMLSGSELGKIPTVGSTVKKPDPNDMPQWWMERETRNDR